MKTAKDPRHQLRRETIKVLFAESFTKQNNINKLTSSVLKQKTILDNKIKKAAPT